MNKSITLLTLVKSLSKSEKRYFKLYSNLQSGEKSYLVLFTLLEECPTVEEVHRQFCIQQGRKSFDMAVKHLYKVLLDSLTHLHRQQDIQAQIFDHISKADILIGRELLDDALAELDKAEKLALHYEKHTLLLIIRQTALKYFSMYDYAGLTEKQLVNHQVRILETIRFARSISMHIQLYDILKYRFTRKGVARSEEQKDSLNDLILSELNLISNEAYKGFESEKLHLLFQATWFLNTGNYKAAIRHYQMLISLFDEHPHMILNPPLYYLNALLGILDSLQSVRLYKEMPFFLNRLRAIGQGDYSNEFCLAVCVRTYLYEFYCLYNTGRFNDALRLRQEHEESIFKRIAQLELNLQLQLHLSMVVLGLGTNELSKARRSMKCILTAGKELYHFPLYKVARLLNLIVQAELGNSEYFESEIKSLKRGMQSERKQYVTEKLLFKFLLSYPLPQHKAQRQQMWKQYEKQVQRIREDKYELTLRRMFDFCGWIESKLTGRSFEETVKTS